MSINSSKITIKTFNFKSPSVPKKILPTVNLNNFINADKNPKFLKSKKTK